MPAINSNDDLPSCRIRSGYFREGEAPAEPPIAEYVRLGGSLALPASRSVTSDKGKLHFSYSLSQYSLPPLFKPIGTTSSAGDPCSAS
jgi:hypothetical protein